LSLGFFDGKVTTRSSDRFELVAHTTSRNHALGSQLLAEIAHVHLYDVRPRIEVVSSDVTQDLLPAEDLSRV
jgi:hypothetical protein